MIPLHLAAESGHIKKVTSLCGKEADINIQDNDLVNVNAGRLADWGQSSFISCKVLNYCLKITNYLHSNSKNPSNIILYVAGSGENNYHIKLINRNTIQSWYMHAMLVYYSTNSVMAIIATFFWLLSPISKLPCILQPAMLMTTQWNALLKKELTWM